uniref:Endonuclease/exonuclease/phosphatase domain-containing protein n=1 Tax=Cannabis sativa TaxID=3483 RepID=A0A803QD86_CANSA
MHTRGFPGPSSLGRHQNPTGFGKKHGHYPTGFGWKNPSGLSVDQIFQKYWSFRTKHKVFMITLTHDGGSVCICERTRLFGYEVVVTIDAVDWIIDTLEELFQKTGTQRTSLKRSFKNSTNCCFLECFANIKGSFLKISVLRNNKFKMIIVPEEENEKGVRPVMKAQYNREKAQAIEATCDRGRIEWKELYPKINLGFKPKNLYPEKRFTQPKFYEYMRSKALPRDWNLAIILTRNNTHADWCTIFYNLSRELERMLVVSQLFDDRCIIWCKHEKDREELIKIHSLKVLGAQSLVTFLAWSLENQKENVKVECRGSWIGVQGLPLNKENWGKVRWETNTVSFLVTMRHNNTSFELKFFKPNDLSYRFHGSFNTCWYQDFDHRKMFGDGEATEGFEKEIAEEKVVEEGFSGEVNTSGGSLSASEKMGFSKTQKAAVEAVQPRAFRPKKSLLSSIDGAAAENDYRHFSINSREGMVSKLCVREQGKVVSLHTVFNRLLRSLRVPRVCRNPSLNVFFSPDNNCQIGEYGLFKMGMGELGRIGRAPVKLGLHNTGPFKHFPNNDGVSGWEFIPGNGLVKHFNLRDLWNYQRCHFNITLDQNFGVQDFFKRAKSMVISDLNGPRRELNVLAKKMNPEQILKEFFHGRLRSIHPKARENFTKAIIKFWEDFATLKRKVSESVLHYKGEMELEEEIRPQVNRVYCRKRKSFGHGCVSHSTEENYYPEFEEADEDPKDINELWTEEAEAFLRQGLGEVKLDDVIVAKKDALEKEDFGGDKEKRIAIKATICKANPDLVILQEVKRAMVDRRFIGSIWRSRFKAWILIPAIGRSGGKLLILDTRIISVLDSLVGKFSISVLTNSEGKEPWWFLGVYGPCSYKLRPEFWDELAGLSSICGESWCVGGDFNVTRRVGEKLNSSSCTKSMKLFDGLIRELQLIDPKLENGSFTWSNFRASPVCCRLDRFLFSNKWNIIFLFVRQEMLVRLVSDHSPVVIDSNPPKWGPRPFRWPSTKFMKKLKILQGKVKDWSKYTFGQNKATKNALEGRLGVLDRLEVTSSWSQSLHDERRKLKEEWQRLNFEEERGISLKSKCKWAKEGDANSRFFHNLLNGRKARKTISRIERDNGAIIDNEKEIVEELIAFFSNLYTSEVRLGTGVEGIE